MDYSQAVAYLDSFINYEQIPGVAYAAPGYSLSHVEELLSRMGAPQLAARTVHIAGTKGKGSVAVMTAGVLSASGYRTGSYTSPHFHDLRERICIDGSLISEERFASTMAGIRPFIEAMRNEPAVRQFTYFEVLTVLAFAYFRQEQVGFQVLEVGLGGRLDATNVARPDVCVITPISLDHMQILGSTLEEIAREKAGIIKPGCRVVLCPQPPAAASVLIDICRERKAEVVQLGKYVTWRKTGGDLLHQSLVIEGIRNTYQVDIPLLGDYQLENAAASVAALEILASAGFAISGADIARGLADVRWPGRFQVLRRDPMVLVDGAHNVASMRRLVDNIRTYFSDRQVLLVFGTSNDKDVPGIVAELAALSPRVVVTRSVQSRAALPASLAAQFSKHGVGTEISESVPQALSRALSMAEEQDLICVTGSLFVVAEALDYFSMS